jgi:chromosome segregation ATPase
MTDHLFEHITKLKSEGDNLRLELKEAEEKSEQLQSKGEKLQHELAEAEKDRDMFKNSTVKLAKQKSKLERQIVNVKGSLCKGHLETIEEIERSLEETASSLPDALQVDKALLSASEKFTEDLSASMVKLEEQLSFSKEELSSLRSACKELEDVPSPTEDQKETLHGYKMKMEGLESTVSSVQLEYDKAVLKLKCCEMDVLRELPLKEEIGYMLQERTEKNQAITISTLKAKQEKLERDEYLLEVMEREKREALLKEENEKLKADLEV